MRPELAVALALAALFWLGWLVSLALRGIL